MEKRRILYPQDNGGVTILIPAEGYDFEAIIHQCVPKGLPYIVVNVDDIPSDRTFRDAWEVDFSNPDGFSTGVQSLTASK